MAVSETSWKPGQSGNPKGAPKKDNTLTGALREMADKQALGEKLIALAMEGNVAALKYVYDRVDGMPRQHIEMSNEKDEEWLEYLRGGPEPEAVGDT